MANKPSVSVTLLQVVTGDGTRVPAILLANKCDLRDESTVSLKMLPSPLYHLPLNLFIVFFIIVFFHSFFIIVFYHNSSLSSFAILLYTIPLISCLSITILFELKNIFIVDED